MMKGERIYGTYLVTEPCLVIKDPDLIKQVLVKDFNHFVDRMGDNGKLFLGGPTRVDTIWRKQLVNSSGELWKNTRWGKKITVIKIRLKSGLWLSGD
jgi:cytochrome P450 family 9